MEIKAILKILEARKKEEVFNTEAFINAHAPKQKEYIRSKARTTMAYGGKRAGKTLASSSLVALMDITNPPGARIEIAGQSLEKVKDLHKQNLINVSKHYNLKYEYHAGDSKFVTPRRDIIFRSLRDIGNADKAVGFRVLMVLIEEVQTIREFVVRHYLSNIIRINTLGVPNARINFAMNPPVFPQPWVTMQLYENPKVKKVHFVPGDNPSIGKRELKAWLKEEAAELGYKSVEEALEKSNELKRNVLGLWIPDMGRVIINPERVQTFDEVPTKDGPYSCVLGVDIGGGKSKDAIVAIIYNKFERKAWLVDEIEIDSSELDIEDLATNIKKFYDKWKPHAIALDYGGVGGRIAGVLRTRFGVAGIIKAIKVDKMSWLETMRTEVYRGRLLFKKDSLLLQEFPQIIYNEDKSEIDDENGIHSDLIDACLYAFRHIYNSYPKERPVKKTYTEERISDLLKATQRRPWR